MTALSTVIQLKISVVCERLVFSGHLHSLFSARCLRQPRTSPLPRLEHTCSPLSALPLFFCSESCAFFHMKDIGSVDEYVRPNGVHFCGRGARVAGETRALQPDGPRSKPGSAAFRLCDLGRVTTVWSLAAIL